MRGIAYALVGLGCSLASSASYANEKNTQISLEAPSARAWPGDYRPQISAAVRAERARIIRDTAAAAGMTNAVLLAGIGEVETNFAHCWSEATWACQGPSSSSCDGGPVIAGSADGPCSQEQGGLGMFQFDAGTYQQTLDEYGPDIVTMAGNVGEVVPFLVTRAIQSVEGVDNANEALEWMNSIPVVDGDPKFEEWLYFVSWRYNGCQGCTSQQNKYRAGTHTLLDEMGAEFWNNPETSSAECELIPSEGTLIEEGSRCYEEFGNPEYWRREDSGHGGALRWTKAVESERSNYAVWNLRFASAGEYEVQVYSDGGEFGQSKQAGYEIVHGQGAQTVVVDQSATEGWISLGSFLFSANQDYSVTLGDNTGEAWEADPGGVRLQFDALRVLGPGGEGNGGGGSNVDGEGEKEDKEGLVGACSSSGSSSGSWLLLILGAFWLRKNKARATTFPSP